MADVKPSYPIFEFSEELSEPVEIYDIGYSGGIWRYTTNTEDVVVDGQTYVATAIKRGETEDSGDATKSNMDVTIGRNTTLGNLFKVTAPSEPITITIRQYHASWGYQEPDKQTIAIWKGRVTNVNWQNDELVLTSESVFSSMLRLGVTRKFSRQCSHNLYGTACNVQRSAFSVTATPIGIVGTVLSIQHGKQAHWFAGGYIRYKNNDTGVIEHRQIIASTDRTVTLGAIPLGIVVGKTEVTMYAGCDKTHQTCINKFDNIKNYGGQPFIPIKNPFNGSSIY